MSSTRQIESECVINIIPPQKKPPVGQQLSLQLSQAARSVSTVFSLNFFSFHAFSLQCCTLPGASLTTVSEDQPTITLGIKAYKHESIKRKAKAHELLTTHCKRLLPATRQGGKFKPHDLNHIAKPIVNNPKAKIVKLDPNFIDN